LPRIIATLSLLLALFLGALAVPENAVAGSGGMCACEWEQSGCETDRDGGQTCQYRCPDGCGSGGGSCGPGFFRVNDPETGVSTCREVGGSCPCGEFYSCPTANNPGKQCACCPAEAACRNEKVDCPAGSVRSLL
jgi:hypothetical protein